MTVQVLNPEIDPLTLLNNEFAKTLERSSAVKTAMALAKKNINAYNKTRVNASQDVVAESDTPEIQLQAAGGPTNINFASNLVQMLFGVNVNINSGDQRVTSIMFPVLWATFATVADSLVDKPLTSLRWRDKPFVLSYEFQQITAGISDPVANRGLKGWIAICQVRFHLYFEKTDISAFIQGV